MASMGYKFVNYTPAHAISSLQAPQGYNNIHLQVYVALLVTVYVTELQVYVALLVISVALFSKWNTLQISMFMVHHLPQITCQIFCY